MAEVIRFSSKELSRLRSGEAKKSVTTAKTTVKVNKKVAKDNSKYTVKIVDGVKHMILRQKL